MNVRFFPPMEKAKVRLLQRSPNQGERNPFGREHPSIVLQGLLEGTVSMTGMFRGRREIVQPEHGYHLGLVLYGGVVYPFHSFFGFPGHRSASPTNEDGRDHDEDDEKRAGSNEEV